MDNVISGFQKLMSIDHIAWSDGPGWLMAVVAGWIIVIAISAAKS